VTNAGSGHAHKPSWRRRPRSQGTPRDMRTTVMMVNAYVHIIMTGEAPEAPPSVAW